MCFGKSCRFGDPADFLVNELSPITNSGYQRVLKLDATIGSYNLRSTMGEDSEKGAKGRIGI